MKQAFFFFREVLWFFEFRESIYPFVVENYKITSERFYIYYI